MDWRCKIAAVLTCLAMLCGGCMGSQEIDDLSFVLTIGVDKADEPGNYIFTFRIAMPKAFAGEGGGDEEKTKLVSVKAPAVGTAVRQLAVAMNRQPELSHVSALFVSEAVAKDGIQDIVSLLLRSKVYRNTMLLLVTNEEVKTAMEKNKTPFELFQYRWVDSVKRTQKFAATYAMNDIRSFYINLTEPQKSILTGYGSTIEKSLDKMGGPPLPDQVVRQYRADDFPREGGTELIVVGSAVFYDWKMVGALNMGETFGANLLGKGVQTVITVPDPVNRQAQMTIGLEAFKPKIDVDFKNGRMVIRVDEKVSCELSDTNSGVDYTKKENRRLLEEQVEKTIKASIEAYFKKTKQLGTDCMKVSNKYRYKTAVWQQWAQIDWPDAYRKAEVQVNVEVSLRRAGLLWRYAGGERL